MIHSIFESNPPKPPRSWKKKKEKRHRSDCQPVSYDDLLDSNNSGGRDSTSADTAFNAALVGATFDQEVATVAPLLVPAVLDLPVLLTILNTVTHEGDGVTPEETGSRSLRVDA